jgi:hypothetical protein
VSEGGRESEEKANEREREFQRSLELINKSGELGLGWFPLDAIGRRGRCFWTASCAESRDASSCVGGVLVRSENG